MLELLVVGATLLAPQSAPDMSTYVIGAPYSLVEVGCEKREDALEVARTYRDAGRDEAWNVISNLSKRLSGDGQPACGNINGSFIFTSEPILEADIDTGGGTAQRLSVVHVHTMRASSYWLLMLNSRFLRSDQ
jgi:hypothetical protein